MLRLALRHEWPTIAAWRTAHVAALGLTRPVCGQRDFDDALWLVIERRGEIVAAASLTDDAAAGMRFVHDLYGAPGHALAALALGELLEGMADDQGMELRCSTDPENAAFARVLRSRGYELTALCFRRVPRRRAERTNEPSDCENLASDSKEQREVSSLAESS